MGKLQPFEISFPGSRTHRRITAWLSPQLAAQSLSHAGSLWSRFYFHFHLLIFIFIIPENPSGVFKRFYFHFHLLFVSTFTLPEGFSKGLLWLSSLFFCTFTLPAGFHESGAIFCWTTHKCFLWAIISGFNGLKSNFYCCGPAVHVNNYKLKRNYTWRTNLSK